MKVQIQPSKLKLSCIHDMSPAAMADFITVLVQADPSAFRIRFQATIEAAIESSEGLVKAALIRSLDTCRLPIELKLALPALSNTSDEVVEATLHALSCAASLSPRCHSYGGEGLMHISSSGHDPESLELEPTFGNLMAALEALATSSCRPIELRLAALKTAHQLGHPTCIDLALDFLEASRYSDMYLEEVARSFVTWGEPALVDRLMDVLLPLDETWVGLALESLGSQLSSRHLLMIRRYLQQPQSVELNNAVRALSTCDLPQALEMLLWICGQGSERYGNTFYGALAALVARRHPLAVDFAERDLQEAGGSVPAFDAIEIFPQAMEREKLSRLVEREAEPRPGRADVGWRALQVAELAANPRLLDMAERCLGSECVLSREEAIRILASYACDTRVGALIDDFTSPTQSEQEGAPYSNLRYLQGLIAGLGTRKDERYVGAIWELMLLADAAMVTKAGVAAIANCSARTKHWYLRKLLPWCGRSGVSDHFMSGRDAQALAVELLTGEATMHQARQLILNGLESDDWSAFCAAVEAIDCQVSNGDILSALLEGVRREDPGSPAALKKLTEVGGYNVGAALIEMASQESDAHTALGILEAASQLVPIEHLLPATEELPIFSRAERGASFWCAD
ncbi:hypothetical protein F0M18_13635 [Pseudohalioglobus sediminis]|uniref:Uncharacterized protein n=1 Tax=Pseudohalioglobus sediminis TaxID=2606449 RepID=A0A5B0WSQ8_9GAMM|nr:hypothetical protein [Pseudohalioglobus sediminis]KAA1190102.1 hypothetical protein F0M18_13635 [Pseudohalioglobus sediminis]